VGPAGGIYQRTPEQQAAYASQLASIPVNTAVPLPVMPMSIGPSAAMARIQRTGEMTPEQYYSNIRESVSSGQYTPAQLRQMQQGVGASSQDINVAFGRGMTPIGQLQPGARDVSVDIPGQFVTEDGGQPRPLSVDISSMPKEQQDLTKFIVGKLPRPTTTSPSMFSPENVAAQLELERLRLQPTPEPPPEEPVAGFAQGGLVNDSSGVRRLEMSGYQEGGDVTDEMFVGTRPTDEGTSPGILPPEIRKPVDVGLDFANMALRGTAAAVAGPAVWVVQGCNGRPVRYA
jgi:hypothetical protein